MTMKVVLLLLAFCGVTLAFTPSRSVFSRTNVVRMSHFSTVKTQLKDKQLLLKSLDDIGVKTILPAAEATLPVRGYNGQTIPAEIAISQENGQDIGFRFNGKAFEMVADLQVSKE